MLRVLFFVAVMTGAAVAQEGTALDDDKRRFLLPNQVNPKSSRCTGFDYYLEPARANGTQFVDRQYYVRTIPTRLRVQCAPGTLFSIAADICVCSTHIRPAFLFNRDRCVTITGSVQDSKRFNLVQRGEAGSRDVSVSGYESIVRTQDNCFGSNTTVFRALDYLRGNSVSRRDFEMSIGFRVPSGVGAGREFQIFGTSPCSGDSRQGSLVITYVTAAFNQLPILTASFLVRDKTAALGSPETTASIQCTIPQSVSGNAQQQYFWDPQDPTNEVTVTVDMDNFSTLSMTLANSQMRTNGAPVGGFCQNNVVNSPLGARGGGKMISERNCAAFFGKAPGNDYMCIYQVRLKRDCIEQLVQ